MYLSLYLISIICLLLQITAAKNLDIQQPETNVLDEVIIDLKSKIYPQTSDRYLYSSNFANEVASSHLHSNQMNSSSLSKYFEIVNKTNVLVVKWPTTGLLNHRQLICSDLKLCDKKPPQNNQICMLNLNLILYMSTRQIKLVNLGIILNDMSDDYLRFEKTSYEFSVDPSVSWDIGWVKATSAKNSDLIKYYVSFKEANRDQLMDLVRIDERSGRLTLNRTKLVSAPLYRRRIEFYVDAVVQCSFGQHPMQNQTLVRLTIADSNQNQPTLNITHLWETKALKLGPKCLRLNQNELKLDENSPSSELALAQIQIDNLLDYDLDYSELNFRIDSVEPTQGPNLVLRHLIDNIFVLYLQKSSNPMESRFLNDLYRVNLKLVNSDSSSVLGDIYICIHNIASQSNFPDELNLVQFTSNVIKLNSVQSSFDIKANKIGPFKSRIRYFLHSVDSSSPSSFKLDPLDNDIVRFSLLPQLDQSVLVREVVLVAYDEIRFPDFRNQYESMRKLALVNQNRLLHFATRLRVIYDLEHLVADQSTAEKIDEIYKFNVPFHSLTNNSVIGYLPNVYDNIESTSFSEIESISYKIANSNVDQSCFRIGKYDGIIYYTETASTNLRRCLTSHYPIKLTVDSERRRLTHVLIYDRAATAQAAPVKPVNILYDDDKLTPSNVNFEINLNYMGSLDYNLDENLLIVNFIPSIGELSRGHYSDKKRFKFDLVTKSDVFQLDTKRSSLYMRKEAIVRQNQINSVFLADDNRCFNLDIVTNEYVYENSTRRKQLSSLVSSINICFYLSKNSNQTDLFLIPIELSALVNFEMLIKSRVLNNYVPIVWYFTLAVFSIIFAMLVLFLVYNSCTSRTRKKLPTKMSPISKSVAGSGGGGANYENLGTKYSNNSSCSASSPSSSSYYENNDQSSSFDRQNELRIRSDHPSIKTGESLGDDLNRIAESYGFFLKEDDRQVPSKLDILLNKKPLPNRRPVVRDELSSIKITENNEEEMLSADHGVYCLATATSFTSNISSVTNSQCVDDAEVDACMSDFPRSASIATAAAANTNRYNKTHLSLFDLTPTSHRLNQIDQEARIRLDLVDCVGPGGGGDTFNYTEIKHIYNRECII